MEKLRKKPIVKRALTALLSVLLVFSVQIPLTQPAHAEQTSSYDYELVDNVQDAAILHCWNWSYKTIEDNMELIAQAGYSAVQTSPATQPKDYAYDGVVGTDVGIPGEGGSGNWWKLYQPVTESVCDNGQTWLGTKEELESMCKTAESYGIKVIVDVVANHMGNITGWKNSLSDVSPQVGEYWNPDMLTDESFWHINDYQCWMSDSRLHFTQGTIGMPDLNTANKTVQKYIADYLDELIDCGVDGFRFDAAKHIETPDDDAAYASDFWPTVLGEARSHYTQKTGDSLYVYGEILNTVGDNFSIDSYTKYMSVTDNSAGNHLLEAYRNNNVGTLSMDYDPSVSVLWAESHDTYMNESSRYASDKSIVRTWAMVANKNKAASLFFVRPYYSSDILENDNDGSFKSNLKATLTQATMGNCETYVWASNEVAAINHFNNRMCGKSETMGSEGNIAYCVRGNGMVIADFNGSERISISAHGMADGTYTDEVSGNTFTVSGGTLSGTIDSEYGIAVVYQNVMPNPAHAYPVQIKSSVGNGTSYFTNSLKVTLNVLYADTASYSASTGESGTFTGETTVELGQGLSKGESVTLTVTASNAKGTKTETYTYYKDEYDLTNCVFFKNTDGWSTVTAYLWNDSSSEVVNNASWPGEEMYECDEEQGIYALKVDPDAGYTKVIFSNNGSSKTEDLDFGGIGYLYDKSSGSWTEYKTQGEKTPSIKASKDSDTITEATDVTFTVSNAEQATYAVNGNEAVNFDGTVTLTVGENLKEGEADTVVISAQNGSKSATKTYTYTMDYKQPVITASEESGTKFKDTLDVTFSIKNASEATITIDGEEETFTDSVTKTFTKTSTVTVSAVNGTKSAEETYKYTKNGDQYIYLNVAGCSWFGNDQAVAAVKFDGETSYTECETTTQGGVTYYQAAVPEGASSVTICRLLPSGKAYNEITVSLADGMNVWTANSGFTSGSWSYNAALAGEQDVEGTMDLYFVNNYDWSGTMYAYYWGGSASVAWPGTAMTYVEKNDAGKSVYKITVPEEINGVIFTNGSSQTEDITTGLKDGTVFSISGTSGSKYSVSAE